MEQGLKELFVNKTINEVLSDEEGIFYKAFFPTLDHKLEQIIDKNDREEICYLIAIELLNRYKNNINFLFRGKVGIETVFFYFEGFNQYLAKDKQDSFNDYLRKTIVHSKNFFDLLLINFINHTMAKMSIAAYMQLKFCEQVNYFTDILDKFNLLPLLKELNPDSIETVIKNSQYTNLYQFKEAVDCILVIMMLQDISNAKDYVHLLQLKDSIMELKDSPCKLLNTLTEEQKDIFFSYGILQEIM